MLVSQYFVYRYIDSKTDKIMYIGKTQQLFVTNRLEQHKSDNVGSWAAKNVHYIEFLELPTKEDMDYLESYLIRKHKPELNIALTSQDAPPFEITITKNRWKNLNDYLIEKQKAKQKPMEIFSKNIKAVEESNRIFNETIDNIINQTTSIDCLFLRYIRLINDLTDDTFVIPTWYIQRHYHVYSIEEVRTICKRLVSYSQRSRIEGTINDIRNVGFFDSCIVEEGRVTFVLNPYIKRLLEKLQP